MGFTRAQLQAAAGTTLPDLLPVNLKLLFVGINPGLWTAAAQAHFAKRGNRFYPALYAAGITDWLIDAADGYRPADLANLLAKGVGVTNFVARATAKASELTKAELQAGAQRLLGLVDELQPPVVAVLGLGAYRAGFGQRDAVPGEQPQRLGSWSVGGSESASGGGETGDGQLRGSRLFVLPNPSGLNAHETVASLAAAYRQAALAAGVELRR